MRFCSIGAVLREPLFKVAVMRLKPGGLRYLDISGNFNAVCGFLMLFCTVFIPVFLCGFAVFLCYSVRCLYRYFCAVLRFSYVILYGFYTGISVRFCGFLMLFCTVFIPVFLCSFAVFLCYSVRCLYRYFCAVLRFSYVILYGFYTGISVRFCGFLMLFCTVFIPVFLCSFAVFLCYSVRCLYRYFCAVLQCSYMPYAPLFLDFCLI